MIDFSKYNKGLRLYAALFELNPHVFNTDTFIDMLILNNNSIGLVYNRLYDQYIISEITQNRFYYNKRLVFYNGTKQYAYVLTLFDKEYIDIYKDIYINGSLLLSKQFLIKVCIIWKDFLSDSFFDCLKCEACEQCQQKARCNSLALFLITCDLFIVVSSFTWNIIKFYNILKWSRLPESFFQLSISFVCSSRYYFIFIFFICK